MMNRGTEITADMDPAFLLAWHVEMGADEAIGFDPVDRFTAPSAPEIRMPAAPRATAAADAPRMVADIVAPTTSAAGPRVVEARPVQSVIGAGPAEAARVAATCNTLEELRAAIEAFDGGTLKRGAKCTVFADGVAGAPLMVVGEAPGADEDREGRPFVGASGQFLDRMLAAAGLSRQTNVYISNVVPWRPLGNRTPDPAVIAMCLPFLMRHIELAKPQALLLVGKVPTGALFGSDDGITRLRGKMRDITAGGLTLPAMPTYHPAFLLRQPAQKGQAWRDLLTIRERLAL
ncbi:uracil-DNA glycosylase [Pseudokordiimonas caeni]|uniref:uracil-DNA glycosylase n=1 Tax=Pseudokordiimonas caeni TaxID=2997908 RepID=UPI0028123779|nr:uracil-DNA glycosylase [Pseudokordiimonas caeni]